MTKEEKLEKFYNKETLWKEALKKLRAYLNKTELHEDWKWNFPTYTVNGQNVIGAASLKNHFGLWFFQGAILKDTHDLLHNAQEGKTKAMRHLRFYKPDDVPMEVVKQYINEAIINAKNGKKVIVNRDSKKIITPEILKNALTKSVKLKSHYSELSLAKQKEYCSYIYEAKRETTKHRRIEKIIPMILQGKGLNDKYRN